MLGLKKRKDLDGNSLTPLLSKPNGKWNHVALSTVGRGTHTVRDSRWRYTRYFDGSEELYDLEKDPEEWANLIANPEYADIKRRLSQKIPEDKNFSHFVRYGDFKAVVPSDGSPLWLYGPKVEMFAESKNVAKNHPKIVAHIEDYLKKNPRAPKHLNLNTL